MLNTPTAALGALVLAVAVNASLFFFGPYSERTASPSSPPPTEATQPETNAEEATTPVMEKPPEESPEQTSEGPPEDPPEEPAEEAPEQNPEESPTATATATATASATASP